MSPNSHSSLTPMCALYHWLRELPNENTGDGEAEVQPRGSSSDFSFGCKLLRNYSAVTVFSGAYQAHSDTLWTARLSFPGHARLAQIPPELQGRHTEDVSWTRLCLCSAPSGGISLRKDTNVFVFLWVHLPNTHVCFRLSGHNIFDFRERQSYLKQQFPLHAVSEGLKH